MYSSGPSPSARTILTVNMLIPSWRLLHLLRRSQGSKPFLLSNLFHHLLLNKPLPFYLRRINFTHTLPACLILFNVNFILLASPSFCFALFFGDAFLCLSSVFCLKMSESFVSLLLYSNTAISFQNTLPIDLISKDFESCCRGWPPS